MECGDILRYLLRQNLDKDLDLWKIVLASLSSSARPMECDTSSPFVSRPSPPSSWWDTMRARPQMTLIFGQRTGGGGPAPALKPSSSDSFGFSPLYVFLCFLRSAASEHGYLHWLHLWRYILGKEKVDQHLPPNRRLLIHLVSPHSTFSCVSSDLLHLNMIICIGCISCNFLDEQMPLPPPHRCLLIHFVSFLSSPLDCDWDCKAFIEINPGFVKSSVKTSTTPSETFLAKTLASSSTFERIYNFVKHSLLLSAREFPV